MRAVRLKTRRSAIPAALALGSFALAFVQRPGKTVFDTRIELSADPSLFLHRVASLWSSTGDLGHVQSGQFVGYLFPMAPWFALRPVGGDPDVDRPAPVARRPDRARRLGRRAPDGRPLRPPARGRARHRRGALRRQPVRGGVDHAGVGGAARLRGRAMADARGAPRPARTSRLALAGARRTAPGGQRGGGERGDRRLGAARADRARALRGGRARVRLGVGAGVRLARRSCAGCVGVAWWAIPLLLQARYGTDFLSFTELPSSVWATTSMSESLRLLGYWLVYLGVGGHPGGLARLRLPLQRAGDRRDLRRAAVRLRRAAPDAQLAIRALLLPARGRRAARDGRGLPVGHAAARHAHVRLLRPRAAALPAHVVQGGAARGDQPRLPRGPGLALLGRAGSGARARPPGRPGHRRWASGAVAAAVAVLFALPLFDGQGHRQARRSTGRSRRRGARRSADAARTTPADHRIMLLPGELFGFYRWGRDGQLGRRPRCRSGPLLVREVVPYADPHAAELQNSVDDLIQQGRLVPGQLVAAAPADGRGPGGRGLGLAAGAERRARPGAARGGARGTAGLPAAGGELRRRAHLRRRRPGAAGGGAAARPRALRHPRGAHPGSSGCIPQSNPVVLDGDAQGVAELAADGGLVPQQGALLRRRPRPLDPGGPHAQRCGAGVHGLEQAPGGGCRSPAREPGADPRRRRSDPARLAEPRPVRLARQLSPDRRAVQRLELPPQPGGPLVRAAARAPPVRRPRRPARHLLDRHAVLAACPPLHRAGVQPPTLDRCDSRLPGERFPRHDHEGRSHGERRLGAQLRAAARMELPAASTHAA